MIAFTSYFGEFHKRMALMVSCYMPLSHSTVPTGVVWLGKWQTIKGFRVGIEFQQGCALFRLFFIIYMIWFDKCSQADKCATIKNCNISCLLFADDLILLRQNPASSTH